MMFTITIFYLLICIQVVTGDIPIVASVSVQQPPPLIGILGRNTLNFQCAAKGNPNPSLSWSFNGTKIASGGRYYITGPRGSILQINDVQYEDSGFYRCHAENTYGTTFGQVNIRLHSSGSFKDGSKLGNKPRQVTVTVGKSLKLDCPPHQDGYGQQYFWGDLPEKRRPIYWTNGEPEQLVFIGKEGALYFVYLTDDHLEKIKNMNGISCIIYQYQRSEQGVRFEIQKATETSSENFAPTFGHDLDAEKLGVVNDQISLVCGATGRPRPKITWYKDGVQLNNGSVLLNTTAGRELLGVDIELVLVPKLSDQGKYACEAENELGKVRSEGLLKLHMRTRFTTPLPTQSTVEYGAKLKLDCVAQGIPEPKYEWHFKGKPLNPSDTVKIDKGVLEISSVNFENSGMYLCIAENYLATVVSPSYVTVGAYGPTMISKLLTTTYFFKTYENTLQCKASGGPLPTITWKVNDKEITDSRFKMTDDGKLVVMDTKEEDSGKYTCIAKNINSEVSDSTNVKVVDKTVITKKPVNLVYPEKYPMAQFFCDATYEESLPVTLEWSKDGQPIVFNKRVHIDQRVSGLSGRLLFIHNAQLSDAGVYTCTVFTKDGDFIVSKDQKSGSLAIIALPVAPQKLEMEGKCKDSDEITLMWEPSVSHGLQIISYIIQYAETKDKTTWLTFKETNSDLTKIVVKVKELPSDNDLVFRIKPVAGHNGQRLVGNASPHTSDGMCMVPLGNAPSGNPSNVRSKIDGEGTLEITWNILPENLRKEDTEYVVGYRKKTDPPSEFKNNTVNGDVSSFAIPDPGVKEEYEVFVLAKNKNGDGPSPKIYTFYSGEEALPGKVENVQQTSVDSTSVGLKWDPVDTSREYQVQWEYEKQRRRRSDMSENSVKTSNTTIVIDKLKSSSKLVFTVSAININGHGPSSDPLKVQTSLALPSVPLNVKVSVIGGSVRVTWEPPTDGSEDVDGYELRWYKTDDPSTKKSQSYGKDSREAFVAGGLEALTYYTFELVPKTKDGKDGMPYTVDRLAVGFIDAPGKPGKPILVKVVEKKDDEKTEEEKETASMDVTFVLPDDYVGGMPTKFNVYYQLQNTLGKRKRRNTPEKVSADYPKSKSITIKDLSKSPYSVWTTGENSKGEGQSSPKNDISLADPSIEPLPATKGKNFYEEIWFIILIILLIILIILVILVYCCCNNRGGGKYPVGEKEKEKGGWDNHPLKDYSEVPMEDMNGTVHTPPEKKEPDRPTKNGGAGKKPLIQSDDDADSLDDYCEDKNFDDDGSFIGQYGDDEKRPAGSVPV